MVVQSVACVSRRFQSLIVRGKNESLYWDTCTLQDTKVQSVHVTYDKWGLMPPYPLNCFQVIYLTIPNVSRNNLEANRP